MFKVSGARASRCWKASPENEAGDKYLMCLCYCVASDKLFQTSSQTHRWITLPRLHQRLKYFANSSEFSKDNQLNVDIYYVLRLYNHCFKKLFIVFPTWECSCSLLGNCNLPHHFIWTLALRPWSWCFVVSSSSDDGGKQWSSNRHLRSQRRYHSLLASVSQLTAEIVYHQPMLCCT